MNSSSCVVVSRICSAPTVDSFSPESCQPDHSIPGLDLVVSIVPRPASVSPPLTLNLIILHHNNYLLPLTFSLLRFLAVSQKMTVQKYLSFCAHFLINKIINSLKIK
jgi:hypothetical protein